jgi:DNA-binding GntR family transcriptional regulator
MNDHATIALDLSADGRTLAGPIAERLRELIIDGSLSPGSRLNERELCERLGVSRTPLRESLRRLAHDGLVTLIPNRGAFVTSMSRAAVRESFEIMGALEALAGELACEHIDDAQVAEIEALTYEMLACHARRDLPEYYRLNRTIHERIAAAAGNSLLDDMSNKLNLRIQNLRFRSNLDQHKWDGAVREHQRMVELLRARDGTALAALMREHLRHKADAVLAMLGDGPQANAESQTEGARAEVAR